MKKITAIFCLILTSLIFSSNANADWLPITNGTIPEGAVVTGYNESGVSKFRCQAYYKGQAYEGYTWQGTNACQLKVADENVEVNNYSVYMASNNTGQTVEGAPGYQCMNSAAGRVCGYGCVVSGSSARCATSADQQCVADRDGNISCGYHCVVTSTSAKCARFSFQQCISNQFGKIACGSNCKMVWGQLECDQTL